VMSMVVEVDEIRRHQSAGRVLRLRISPHVTIKYTGALRECL
jgi:hypothetical protein